MYILKISIKVSPVYQIYVKINIFDCSIEFLRY